MYYEFMLDLYCPKCRILSPKVGTGVIKYEKVKQRNFYCICGEKQIIKYIYKRELDNNFIKTKTDTIVRNIIGVS